MLREFVRLDKNNERVEKVHLLDANPSCASTHYSDEREGRASVSDLSPCSRESIQSNQSNDEPQNWLVDEETSMV